MNVRNDLSSIWHRDSNAQPLGHESPPVTTKLLHIFTYSFYIKNVFHFWFLIPQYRFPISFWFRHYHFCFHFLQFFKTGFSFSCIMVFSFLILIVFHSFITSSVCNLLHSWFPTRPFIHPDLISFEYGLPWCQCGTHKLITKETAFNCTHSICRNFNIIVCTITPKTDASRTFNL